MSDNFDWCDKPDLIIVPSQPAIAIYLNPHDAVVIRQEGHYGPDEDQWVYVTKENVPRLVQALLEAAGYETATTYGEPLMLPAPKDKTAAERMRRYRNKHRNDTVTEELPLRPVTNGHHQEVLQAAE